MPPSTSDKPADFDRYWQTLLDELSYVPVAPEVVELPARSTDFATAYTVRLTSSGPYRLFAYLSIPQKAGPHPARYYLPRYGSVVELLPQGASNDLRREYVTCSIGVRGQRETNQPYAASFPGLLTEGIDDPVGYVYRGIVADCCRGLEYLVGRPEVDRTKLVAMGNDLALITAALCPQVTHVVCTPELFNDTKTVLPQTSAYPLEEINDYLRYYPSSKIAVLRTLSYFDLRWFGERVKASALIMGGNQGELMGHEFLQPLVHWLGKQGTLRMSQRSTFVDGVHIEEWLTRQLGLDHPILPEHWQHADAV